MASLKWISSAFKYCDGTNWQPLSGSQWTTTGASIYYASGNVGVGTNNPTYPLSIMGTAAGTGNALFKNLSATGISGMDIIDSSGTFQGRIGYDNGNTKTIFSSLNRNLAFQVSGSDVMTLLTGGRVGIGTTSPAGMLHLTGTVTDTSGASYGAIFQPVVAAAHTGNTVGLYGQVNASLNSGTIATLTGTAGEVAKTGTGVITAAYALEGTVNNWNATGPITTAYALYLPIPARTGAVINDFGVYQEWSGMKNFFAGAVGIGTASPAGLLHLHTTGADQNLFLSSTAPSLKLMNNASVASASMTAVLAMATSNGHFGLNAGDVLLGAYNNSRGNIYINSNYAGTGTTNVILQPTSGNVGIGTTGPVWKLDVNGGLLVRGGSGGSTCGYSTAQCINYSGGSTQYGTQWVPASDSTYAAVFFNAGGSPVGSIYTTSTATAFTTTSDRRLKKNIKDSSAGLDRLMRIAVEEFSFIHDKDKKRVQGFIAQDLIKVYPEAVTTNGDDGRIPLGKNKVGWAVDYGRLTPLLVKALQEVKADNDNLRHEFEAYKAAHP